MNRMPWLKRRQQDEPPPEALVRGRTLRRALMKIVNLKFDVRGVDSREIDGGVEVVLPALLTGDPPLSVYPSPSPEAGWCIRPGTVELYVPDLGGQPIDAEEPPVLTGGPGLIVLAVRVWCSFTQDGYRPHGRVGNDPGSGSSEAPVQIGWSYQFSSIKPVLTWGAQATGGIGGDGTLSTYSAGRMIIPLATITQNGQIIQHLVIESGTDLALDVTTALW